jgi:hypothetical protein
MIGICPHCKIRLKEKPFSERITNEIIIVINYRKKIESKAEIKTIEQLQYCEICNATLQDIKEQKRILMNK